MRIFLKLIVIISLILGINATDISAQHVEKINILLLGVDAGYELDRKETLEGGRSDAIMILTLDKASNSVTISTIPRDSLVTIPNRGLGKLTHSFAFGGIDLTLNTIQEWLGIKFDYYIVSNMPGFVKIIDLLGGVDVIPPITFNWWEQYFFEENVPQHLDGNHALAYARERMTSGGDYARQARMREMMSVIIKQMIEKGSIEEYREEFENRYQYIQTNLSFDIISNLYNTFATKNLEVYEFQLSGNGILDEQLGYVDEIKPESFNELMLILK